MCLEAVRVSRSIKIFMVMNHHIEHLRINSFDGLKRIESELRMFLHDSDLVVIKQAGLFQNSNRDSGFSDIMEQTREGQFLLVLAEKSKMSAERDRHSSDQQAMLIGLAMMLANDINPVKESSRFNV